MKWFKNPDWWMVILTALLFFVGVVTLIIFHRQFKEMAKQTGILNSQAQQAAADSVEAAKRVEGQLTIARQQMQAALKSATVTEEQMQLDQRAWVGLKEIGATVEVGKPFFCRTALVNSGKSPALGVTNWTTIHFSDKPLDVAEWMKIQTETKPLFLTIGDLFPDVPISGSELVYNLRAAQIEAIAQGRQWMYVLGGIRYRDIFTKRHTTTFCYLWIPQLNAFDPGYGCKRYNRAN